MLSIEEAGLHRSNPSTCDHLSSALEFSLSIGLTEAKRNFISSDDKLLRVDQ